MMSPLADRTYRKLFTAQVIALMGTGLSRAVSEQIGLRRAGEFHSLHRCKILTAISTVRPR
jgi:hypothetical protein